MKSIPASARVCSNTRRRVRNLTACLASGIVLLGMAGTVEAAPRYLRLSYSGDTTTTMSVAWNTDSQVASEVQYGLVAGTYTKTVAAKSSQANGELGWVHEATLEGLQADAQYYYRAGSAADGYTAESTFRTGPVQSERCGSVKFAFLGDNRPDPTFGGGENWPKILEQSVGHNPAFLLNGGDLVIEGDQLDQWNDLLGWTQPVASKYPFMPVIGNHDTGPGEGETANFNQLFVLPRSTGAHGSGTEDYYYFTYGNAIFVALSTEGFKGGTPVFSEQAAWLDEVLTANPRKWKFIYYHKPTYTHESYFSISHGANEAGQNEAFVPVFDKHHVDVVFTSHNHWYERFEPSACGAQGKPGSAAACSVGKDNFAQGTVYFVSGGAGAFTIPAFLCGSETGRATCAGKHHYILVDIHNEVAKLETWSAYPEKSEVIDTITITKASENCTSPQDAGPEAAAPDGGSGGAAGGVGTGGAGGSQPDASPGKGGAAGTGGAPGKGGGAGQGGEAEAAATSDGGCGCRTDARSHGFAPLALLLGVSIGLLGMRRRGA